MNDNSFYKATDAIYNIIRGEEPQYKLMKKVILFLSDGGDRDSNQKLVQSLERIKKEFKNDIIAFWCMGFGPGADVGVSKQMTDIMKECGGQ